jgi:16S rRNA (guanine(527)-N(7))-methyltransferase RsmG
MRNSEAEFRRLLRVRTEGIADLTPEQELALFRHFELVLGWNRVLNLTRIEDLAAAVDRHYAESLYLASFLPVDRGKIVDIGSGAGFPGFPVAVLRPDCDVVLVESHRRKSAFLTEAGDLVTNVQVCTERIELVEGFFDVAVSRAVQIGEILPWAREHAGSIALLTTPGLAEPLADEVGRLALHTVPWLPEHVVATGEFHVKHPG